MNACDNYRAARDFLLQHRQDYEVAKAGFRWPDASIFNWASDHFDDLAKGNDDLALWIVDESGVEVRRTFEEMRVASNRTANFLASLGIGAGDRVLLMLPNRVELWELMLGAMKIGAVVSPATMLLSEADLADRIIRGQMRAVIADTTVLHQFEGIADECIRIAVGDSGLGWIQYAGSQNQSESFDAAARMPNDPCVLYFTSGTTSKPKMVLHTHRSYPVGHLSTMYWIGLQPRDVHFNISSAGWAKHAWSCFFAPWTVGATVFVYNQSRFNAAKTLATITRCAITTICAPPTAWRAMIQEELGSYPVKLREVLSAGEPCNPEVIEQVKTAWGLTVREGYGQTESTAMIGNSPNQPIRPGSMGRPLPGYEIELLNAEGQLAREGEVSVRLSPRPAGIMAGYEGDAERTRKALGGSHYGTSDVATIDDDGYFWFVGRTDDVFKSSDYRISPFELESALVEHPDVVEAAVVESPDPKRLFVPKAFITLRDGVVPDRKTALALFTFARARLAPYQRIRLIEFGELPKTVSGKIRRVDLRKQEAKRRSVDARTETEFFEADLQELADGRRPS